MTLLSYHSIESITFDFNTKHEKLLMYLDTIYISELAVQLPKVVLYCKTTQTKSWKAKPCISSTPRFPIILWCENIDATVTSTGHRMKGTVEIKINSCQVT